MPRMLTRNPGLRCCRDRDARPGIGANTAMVSVAYAVLVKPLPYPQPDDPQRADRDPGTPIAVASIPASIQTFIAWRSAPTV